MIRHDIPLPRLLRFDSQQNKWVTDRWVSQTNVTVNLSITPLSYATIDLPVGESLPARGYVELYTSMGSAGIFRVRSPQDSYGQDNATAELEHAIVEVGDYLVLGEYDEMMPATTAMQTVFSHYRGGKWQLGDVSALGTGQIAVQVDHGRVLEAMLGLMDQVPSCMLTFDFSTTPWTVSVAQRGTVVAAEGRLSRNVQSARVTYDDTELCTKAYYDVTTVSDATDVIDGSSSTTTWYSEDADTINTWGIVERDVNVGAGATLEEAQAAAREYLSKHKNPRVSISIGAEDFSAVTGEPWDTFTIGKLFRLALPDYNNLTVEQNITGLAWSDVYGNPAAITVTLAEEEDTAVNFIHDLDAKGGYGAGGGSGGSGKKKNKEWKEYWTDMQMDDKHIELMAAHVDTSDRILEQAGMYLDSEGVLIYAQDNENNIGSHIQVEADRISLVVEGYGDNAHIKPASIVSAINDSGDSSIVISADHIELDGDVLAPIIDTMNLTAQSIDVYDGEVNCGSVNCGQVDCTGVNTNNGDVVCADLSCTTFDSQSVSWQNATFIKTVGKSGFTKKFRLSDGTTWEHYVVTDVGTSEDTIYYLGR